MKERRAKIIGTLGPSSCEVSTIKELIKSGLNVARINMSHGTHEGHEELVKKVRQAGKEVGKEIGILFDLQGPKIRVSKLDENLELNEGEVWELGEESLAEGRKLFIPTMYREIAKDADIGNRVLFDDGLLEAIVIDKKKNVLKVEIIEGGVLKSNKGINLPDSNVSAPSLTEKDREDLLFAIRNEADYIALSFVRTENDVRELKKILHRFKSDTPVISKIEKPEAIENIDSIIKISDVIMIARGDMGVELGNHLVPSLQKEIINKCNAVGVPVVTATQMLESMITNLRPTRAEASDVANAIWDGSDAVMLSGETAAGRHPVDAIKMMNQVILEAERTPKVRPYLRSVPLTNVTEVNQVAASLIAEKVSARWILSLTQRGNSCLKMTRFRPQSQVLGVTPLLKTVRRMSLYWGITPYHIDSDEKNILKLEKFVLNKLKEEEHLSNGDKVVITHGDGEYFKHGTSNSIRVEHVKVIHKNTSNNNFQTVESKKGKIILDTDICGSCQMCVTICPFGIWDVVKEKQSYDTKIVAENFDKCMYDNACVETCPTGAIEIISKSR